MLDQILIRIRESIRDYEHADDVITMCVVGSTVSQFHGSDPTLVGDDELIRDIEKGSFAQHLYFVSTVICILAKNMKPRGYADEMEATRLSYKGISSSSFLLREFVDKYRLNVVQRGILTVEQAVQSEVWAGLRSSRAGGLAT